MSSILRHHPISLDREDDSNKISIEKVQNWPRITIQHIFERYKWVMVFVIVIVSRQQTSEYCEWSVIFRRHILTEDIGQDENIGNL